MAEILEFGKKAQDLKSVRDDSLRRRKIESLRKIFQCTRCLFKCSKCGAQLDGDDQPSSGYATPYTYCSNCREEYEEYRARSEGARSEPKYYWHNDLWMKVWESWLEHQRCLDEYRQSKEFLQLLHEVEELLGQ